MKAGKTNYACGQPVRLTKQFMDEENIFIIPKGKTEITGTLTQTFPNFIKSEQALCGCYLDADFQSLFLEGKCNLFEGDFEAINSVVSNEHEQKSNSPDRVAFLNDVNKMAGYYAGCDRIEAKPEIEFQGTGKIGMFIYRTKQGNFGGMCAGRDLPIVWSREPDWDNNPDSFYVTEDKIHTAWKLYNANPLHNKTAFPEAYRVRKLN